MNENNTKWLKLFFLRPLSTWMIVFDKIWLIFFFYATCLNIYCTVHRGCFQSLLKSLRRSLRNSVLDGAVVYKLPGWKIIDKLSQRIYLKKEKLTDKIPLTAVGWNDFTIVFLFNFETKTTKSFIGLIKIVSFVRVQVRLTTERVDEICPITNHFQFHTYIGGC